MRPPIGVVGNDQAGVTLRKELERMGMDTAGVIVDEARATTVKTRIIAHHQQVCRADRECRDAVVGAVLDQLLAAASRAIQKTVGTVISDYAKGSERHSVTGPRLFNITLPRPRTDG